MLFFFFFKQKTAYEMRISDWSSDVCSSDLAAAELPALHSTHPGLWAARGTHAGGRTRHPQHPHLALFQRRAGSRAPSISAQIGRASCRERVCQYVSISVVPVTLKKKQTQNPIHTPLANLPHPHTPQQ